MAVRNLVTAEELERMGRADLELVRGELVPAMTPAGERHGTLAAFLTAELWPFVRAHNLGRVHVEVGYKLFSDPDTVRGPDVSFVSAKRQPRAKPRRGFVPGAPDLAIEMVSSERPLAQVTAKALEYIESGAQLVWVVDPDARVVSIHRPGQPVLVWSERDTLSGEEVLPGFTLPLSRLFAELD